MVRGAEARDVAEFDPQGDDSRRQETGDRHDVDESVAQNLELRGDVRRGHRQWSHSSVSVLAAQPAIDDVRHVRRVGQLVSIAGDNTRVRPGQITNQRSPGRRAAGR